MKKSILICGGTGFLGYHLAKKLELSNWKIYSISTRKPQKLRKIKNVKYLYCDISKKKNLHKILNKINVDFVVNFSGYVDHTNKKKTISSHYFGLKNLINFYLKKKISKFIQIGSSLEYGKSKSPHKESIKIKIENLKSPYSRSKLKSTKFLEKIGKKFKFPYIIVRPYLIYGPYQDSNRIIPFVINKCLENKSFPTSSGNQKRDFLYVNDFIKILYKLMINQKIKREILNIGTGKSIKVKNVIYLIKKKIGSGKPIFDKIRLRKDESKIYYPDIKKLRGFIKDFNFTDLNFGLNKTINYYAKRK